MTDTELEIIIHWSGATEGERLGTMGLQQALYLSFFYYPAASFTSPNIRFNTRLIKTLVCMAR